MKKCFKLPKESSMFSWFIVFFIEVTDRLQELRERFGP